MSLRILSGLIFADPSKVPQSGGFATITFDPFALVSATGGVSLNNRTSTGPAGRFRIKPTRIISAREILLGAGHVTLGINETVTRDEMTVRWSGGNGGNAHVEIPFLVAGDVPDASPSSKKRPAKRNARRRT
jgi:hypothetical protein